MIQAVAVFVCSGPSSQKPTKIKQPDSLGIPWGGGSSQKNKRGEVRSREKSNLRGSLLPRKMGGLNRTPSREKSRWPPRRARSERPYEADMKLARLDQDACVKKISGRDRGESNPRPLD